MDAAIYAIGDIHGRLWKLDVVLERIERDGGASARVVFLGDYIDRGPDSAGVITRLIEGRDAGRNWVFLKGNHDRMFAWFLEPEPRPDPYLLVSMSWLHEALGGRETLGSYGVEVHGQRRLKDVHAEARQAVPEAHRAFLADLTLSLETADVFFAHAGIRPGVALACQDEEDLLWIRQEFHLETSPHPKLIVHGHTPVDAATHYGNRVNLDTGAGYGKAVSAAVFENGEAFLLTETGRRPLARGAALT
jgi:serine/threonine protein phosphatase 1